MRSSPQFSRDRANPSWELVGNSPTQAMCLAFFSHAFSGHNGQKMVVGAGMRAVVSERGKHSLMRKVMGLTRFSVFVPALASILGALLLMAQGSVAIVQAVISVFADQTPLKDTVVSVLTAVDALLLGTVLLVIGYGLYELFVDSEIEVPEWLHIRNLEDLKSKLIGVVVAIIAVIFVGVLVDSSRAADVLSFGVGAGALVLALGIFSFAEKKTADKQAEDEKPSAK